MENSFLTDNTDSSETDQQINDYEDNKESCLKENTGENDADRIFNKFTNEEREKLLKIIKSQESNLNKPKSDLNLELFPQESNSI